MRLIRYYAIQIYFYFPQKKSFGLSALEAVAHGVPVISSNAGGISEVNVDDVSAIYRHRDVDTMVVRAKELLSNDELHSQFKKQAKHKLVNFLLKNYR